MTSANFQENRNRSSDSLIQLEFAKVVRLMADYTQTSFGQKLALKQVPENDIHQIRRKLREAEETLRIVAEEGALSLADAKADLSLLYEQLNTEGLKVQAKTLLEVLAALEVAAVCRRRLLKSDVCPSLSEMAQKLTLFPELAADIKRSIGSRAEILDTASFEIADLRDSLRKERRRMKQHLEKLLQKESLRGVFQELIFTERNGRYVLPVRADHSGQIKGFVHDVSASGQTLYLEPSSALEGNNNIQTLIKEIDREEERILLRLSAKVRTVRKEMAGNQEVMARLDVLHAIAALSLSMNCVVPTLLESPSLKLHDARHPLLVAAELKKTESSPVVPIEVVLNADCQALVVSGPNAGGKTVALKTAGLLVLMTRAGLPIPCAVGSSLFPFAPVMTDIGDEQSIEASLSTYSGHLLRWLDILSSANEKSLVLLDELGTGTDPGEGAALALAMVEQLRSQGARVMATTHFHAIKGYAELEHNVESAAVEFDTQTLMPTYRLLYGMPGASHAFTIARQIGLPESLLEDAQNYLGKDELEGGAVLERLQALRAELDEELAKLQTLRFQAEQERTAAQKNRETIKAQEQDILENVRRQGKKILRDAENKLHDIFEKASSGVLPANKRSELSHALKGISQNLPDPIKKPTRVGGPQKVPEDICLQEILYVPALGVEAVVSKMDGDKIELLTGGKKLRQHRTSLRQFQPRRFLQKERQLPRLRDRVERSPFQPRLVLVGKRVEEAEHLLDRFLDEAFLHGEYVLEVVHGTGEGVLRNAVREFLAMRSDIDMYHAALPHRGGDNVTVIELRH